jgi:hypothetical protein
MEGSASAYAAAHKELAAVNAEFSKKWDQLLMLAEILVAEHLCQE